MSEPVNLNKARKLKARQDAQATAAQNRLRFGRTKAEKAADEAARAKTSRDAEGHKRER